MSRIIPKYKIGQVGKFGAETSQIIGVLVPGDMKYGRGWNQTEPVYTFAAGYMRYEEEVILVEEEPPPIPHPQLELF